MDSGTVRRARPTSRGSDFPPSTTGMVFASHAHRRVCAALICVPKSNVATPSPVRTASQSMVTVKCGGSPAVLGSPGQREPAHQTSSRASALRCPAVRGSGCPQERVGVRRVVRSTTGPRHGGRVRGSPPPQVAHRGGPTTATPPPPDRVGARRGMADRPGRDTRGSAGRSYASASRSSALTEAGIAVIASVKRRSCTTR